MAPKYTLTYFACCGITETIRYLLSYGNLEFEDVRHTIESWTGTGAKEKTPFGVVPTLEFEGKTFSQSTAIARYFGTILKLAGSNPLENLEIDQIVETLNDLRQKSYKYFYTKTEEEKQKELDDTRNVHVPFYFERLEKIAKENNGHLALKKLTWADFHLLAIVDNLIEIVDEHVMDKYPTLEKIASDVAAIPAIKAYIQKRPPNLL